MTAPSNSVPRPVFTLAGEKAFHTIVSQIREEQNIYQNNHSRFCAPLKRARSLEESPTSMILAPARSYTMRPEVTMGEIPSSIRPYLGANPLSLLVIRSSTLPSTSPVGLFGSPSLRLNAAIAISDVSGPSTATSEEGDLVSHMVGTRCLACGLTPTDKTIPAPATVRDYPPLETRGVDRYRPKRLS
uniref:Uncharacterized protein n=1 Tax=Pristionchus pacificus TaxID=54126 RepID=A0A8R1UY21_PRIPA